MAGIIANNRRGWTQNGRADSDRATFRRHMKQGRDEGETENAQKPPKTRIGRGHNEQTIMPERKNHDISLVLSGSNILEYANWVRKDLPKGGDAAKLP